MGKGENAGNQHFLLFPQYFLPIPKRIYVPKLHVLFRLQMLSVLTSLKMICLVKSEPFPKQALVFMRLGTSLLKTLWEKEKLLVTGNFFFSLSVFYPFGELSAVFIKFEIVVCKLFQFGRV